MAVLMSLAALTPGSRAAVSSPQAPRLVLWAWERPEDLRFLGEQRVGVAYLAGTLNLHDQQVVIAPRRQPLRVPPNGYLIAVVRLEASRSRPPSFDDAQQRRVVQTIAGIARSHEVREVQVDFDATASQRDAYRALLSALRAELRAERRLTMTALASWCMFDRWIDAAPLPVDEIVPMVFAMGRGGPELSRRLATEGDFRSEQCRSAVGISTNDTSVSLPPKRRTYVFNPRPWTASAYASIRARLAS